MVRKDYISWDTFFMRTARTAAQRSKDPKTQVGCVIKNELNHVVAVGYNGMPRGIPDTDEFWNDSVKHDYVVHAEANAILNSTEDLTGSTAYVTLFPCNECTKLLIQKGIKEIVYEDDKFHNKKETIASRKLLDSAGVEYRQYENEKETK